MDDSKKQQPEWQIDDILRELGMFDDNLSDVPSAPEQKERTSPGLSQQQEQEKVVVEFPQEDKKDLVFSDEEGETKVWPALVDVPHKVSSKDVLFTAPSNKQEQPEAVSFPAPEVPTNRSEDGKPADAEGEEEELTLKQEIFEWVKAIVISFAVVFLIFGVLIKVVTVDGVSMEPTLHNNDRLVISKLFYTPEQGDIVVLSKESGLDKALIKRIIATEGQTLDITEGGSVTVNRLPLDEPYIKEKILPNLHGQHDYPVTVPQGHVFVMGDNRNDSTDSRFAVLSFVDEKNIMGRVLLRLYPLNKIGTVK